MKVLRHGKAVEMPEPPAVDTSSETVAAHAKALRASEWTLTYTQAADLLEALAADRDKQAAIKERLLQAIARYRERVGEIFKEGGLT